MFKLISELLLNGKLYLFINLFFFSNVIVENSIWRRDFKNILAIISFFILFLFNGLRWETGTDWDSYKDLFDSIEFDWSFLLSVYSFDIGYVFLNAFVRFFSNNYTLFLLIDSFIALYLLLRLLIKYSHNPNLSIFVFYNAFFVAQFMGSNRRMIALVLCLFAFTSLKKDSIKRFGFYTGIAFLFHRSSLITLFVKFLPTRRFSLLAVVILLFFGLVLGVPQLPAYLFGVMGKFLVEIFYNPIFEKLAFYSENSATPENFDPVMMTFFSFFKRSIFLVFYFLVIKYRKGKLDSKTDFFFNIYILGFFIYTALNGSTIFQILSAYFTFVEVVLIGRMWFYASKKLRIFFLPYLFVYGIIQLLTALRAYPELYMPYRSIFSIF